MKGPNEKGREDSKRTISDDLETQNFRSRPPPLSLSGLLRTPWSAALYFSGSSDIVMKVFSGRLQMAYWNVAEENGTSKSKVTINIFNCFKMSYTTKFHGILIFVHLKSRSSCWFSYINFTQNDVERSRTKNQPMALISRPLKRISVATVMIWDRSKIHKLYLGLSFFMTTIDKFMAIWILKLSWTYHFL